MTQPNTFTKIPNETKRDETQRNATKRNQLD